MFRLGVRLSFKVLKEPSARGVGRISINNNNNGIANGSTILTSTGLVPESGSSLARRDRDLMMTYSTQIQNYRGYATVTEEDIRVGPTDPSPPLPPPATVERGPLPLITSRELPYLPPHRLPRQAWVDNLDTIEEKKLGLVDLHPDVFGTFPRIDIIHANVVWQKKYKYINWDWAPTRAEVHGTNRKPWPQKGTGRARHANRKSPLWIKGGQAHGPRGPTTSFYMLNFYCRVLGLCSTLSVKLAQDDLKIVDTLDIPSDDPKYLQDLIEERKWGMSTLFVDDTDIMPRNISIATESVGHLNLMPVYGLNVYSMLKHDTLVLTIAALNRIEEKLIFHHNRHDALTPTRRYTKRSPFQQK